MTMENKSSFEKFKTWMKESLAVKLFVIFFTILILMIPKALIQELINERKYLSESVIREVGEKWGGAQSVNGPILEIPFEQEFVKDNEEIVMTKHLAYFLPNELNFDANVDVTRDRGRGIYNAIVYTSKIQFNGDFKIDLDKLNLIKDQMLWEESKIIFGISDLKGIAKEIDFQFDDQSITLEPGIPNINVLQSGLHGNISLTSNFNQANFQGTLDLQGSEKLFFGPLGKQNKASISSSWPSPSFTGYFLPTAPTVELTGFDADWEIYSLSRNLTQQFVDRNDQLNNYNYGVRFMDPVDLYSKSSRTSKYALLLISLTFLVYLFFEVIQRKSVHPIQYILVGLALMVFYVLLLSLSEHIGFNRSYMIASAATIGLIIMYSKAIFKSFKLTGILSIFLAFIFGFVFVILQLEDYALLVGSIGLFVILGIVMMATRKLNWYTSNKEDK